VTTSSLCENTRINFFHNDEVNKNSCDTNITYHDANMVYKNEEFSGCPDKGT
jgi:hypothetical protein